MSVAHSDDCSVNFKHFFMKAKAFFFGILFLFLTQLILVGCETPEQQDEIELETKGLDRSVQRPGTQGR